jgi:serine/threonine protein kinase
MTEGTVANDSLIGTTLDDRFTVVSLISKGGLSVLYKGVDKSSSQQVTIRVLTAERSDEEQSIARFNSAVKLMEGLRHANIVAIVGSGATPAGAPYLVLPFVDGRSVRDKVDKEGRLTFEQALPIIKGIGNALEYAHQHGIIHRNLKPSNILLAEVDGAQRPMLTGFGIAKKLRKTGESSIAQTTKVVGSPLYMSPEQFINSKIDARSDIYSFGCVIHQMLSGTPPFEAPSLVQLMGAHHHQYRPHFAADLEVPAFVDDILDGATMKLPGNRYQSVAQMVADFEAKQCSLDLAGARKREPSADEEIAQRQHTIKSAAIITAGSVLLIALIIFVVGFDSLNRSRNNNEAAAPVQKFDGEDIRKLVDSGRYTEAIALESNQLMLATASGERTEGLTEKLGALTFLNKEMGPARDYYEQAIKARRQIVAAEPDTTKAEQQKINEDFAMIGLTYVKSDPAKAQEIVDSHLHGVATDATPMVALAFQLRRRWQYAHNETAARKLTEQFPALASDDPDQSQLDEYLINVAEHE